MEVDTTSSNASLKAKTTPGPKSNFAPGFVFFFLWEGGTCLSKEEAHCLHFTGSLSCIDFDGFSLCNRGHLVQWFSAGNYYGPKWGLPLLKLHFSCNLGAFTLFLQSVTPPPPPSAQNPWSSTQTAPRDGRFTGSSSSACMCACRVVCRWMEVWIDLVLLGRGFAPRQSSGSLKISPSVNLFPHSSFYFSAGTGK